MIKSSLTTAVVEASSSNYNQGRFGYKTCKITPHHMAGVLSGTQCAQIFQNPSRQASANYCIGNEGDIVCCVGEENRAWTSSSKSNDCQAITIEVSNCEIGGQWRVSDAAWNALVNLCVDICKRYKFKLTYDGTPNGSLTRHNMFASTNCPGPYLQSRFQELADTVNARLDGGSSTSSTTFKVGDEVTINGVYVSSTSTEKLIPAVTKGKITKIVSGAPNPYLLNDGNIGWVNDGCITTHTPTVEPSKPSTTTNYKVGDTVTINGVYVSSTSTEKLTPAVKSGTITKVVSGVANPYLLNDGNIGWVNDGCIVSSATTANVTYKTITNCTWLNLRTSADYGSNIYKAVKAGTKVEYLGIENGWAKVKYDGKTLYCGSGYLK